MHRSLRMYSREERATKTVDTRPLKIKQRAGHKTFATTERYIRSVEELREGFGTVFPELPRGLVEAIEAMGHSAASLPRF